MHTHNKWTVRTSITKKDGQPDGQTNRQADEQKDKQQAKIKNNIKAILNCTSWLDGAGTLDDLGAELGLVSGIEFLFPDTSVSSGVDDCELSSSSRIWSIISPQTCKLGSTIKSMKPVTRLKESSFEYGIQRLNWTKDSKVISVLC